MAPAELIEVIRETMARIIQRYGTVRVRQPINDNEEK